MANQYELSPVDYAAWARGYVPPSEHVLIDALAYRGARVVQSLQVDNLAVWLVVRCEKPLSKAARTAIRHGIFDVADALEMSLDRAERDNPPITEATAEMLGIEQPPSETTP